MFSNRVGRGASSVLVESCLLVCGAVAMVSCGSTGGGADAGFVAGAMDMHCMAEDGGSIVQSTSMAVCHQPEVDGGVPEAPPPLFNSEGDDDDCKYHLKVSSTPVKRNENVTFTLVGTNKTDGTSMVGADTLFEGFLSDTHPAPNSGTATTESPNGTYTIGPVKFDAPGRWTVKFHFFHHCTDAAEDSPHGHVAFSVDVP